MTKCGQTFKNCQTSGNKVRGKKKMYGVIMFGVMLVVGVFMYLLQVNTIAAKGFKVRDLENAIQKVQDDNEKLAVRLIEMQATSNVDARIKHLGMVGVDKVEYLGTTAMTVAQR